jgi:hypothetical protein
MKSTTSSNEIVVDIPTLLTRKTGLVLMCIGAALGIIFWINNLFIHIGFFRTFNTPAVWIGGVGLVLYGLFWLLKMFGYTK